MAPNIFPPWCRPSRPQSMRFGSKATSSQTTPPVAWSRRRLLVRHSVAGVSDVPLFPERQRGKRVGNQTAKFVTRDNLRHRRDIESAYLAAIRTAKREIIIANAYFFPGIRFRRALATAAQRGVKVTLLL